MKLIDVVTSPWAIEPSKLIEIQAIYATHLRGEKIDLPSLEARMGRPLANEAKRYEVVDGVALVSIDGVLAKRANMFTQISGGTSMQLAERDLKDAVADSAVHSIILMVDSPGGTVDGTQALANAVRAASQSKPVVALASGTMASAAYWVGSAAQAVYIADGTTTVGSIGVVAKHLDTSRQEEMQGVKTTEITAGKYKRIASQHAPLTEEGRANLQGYVDYVYAQFVEAVAEQRGASIETVLSDMADGRVFVGKQAIDAGLVDGVMPLDALVQALNESRASGKPVGRAGVAQLASNEGTPMTLDDIKSQHPALAQALRDEGAAAERARIQAIEAVITPGHEATIAALKFDGASTAGDAAIAILSAENKARKDRAADLAKDAPQPVANAPAVDPAISASEKTKAELVKDAEAYMATHPEATFTDAYKAVGGK